MSILIEKAGLLTTVQDLGRTCYRRFGVNPNGVMDPAAFETTARIARQFKVIKKAPSAGAYRTDIAKAAVATLKKDGVDVFGKSWKKASVKVTPGGK